MPIMRQPQLSLVTQLIRGCALRIEHVLIPAENRQLRGHGGAGRKSSRVRRRNKIESHVESRSAWRDVDVESIKVDRVAPPSYGSIIAANFQIDQVRNRTGRSMFTRNPLWIEERQRARVSRNVKLD